MGRQSALDFGCGVGRLTQALCEHFFSCQGVDIAPSMIEQANRLNQHGHRCRYAVNDADNLGQFDDRSFDFVYSNIVLQHIRPDYTINYIKEFARVLANDGVCVFQVPSERKPAGFGALPVEAYRARIRPHTWSVRMDAGTSRTLEVTVENRSAIPWPAHMDNPDHPPIFLGNHWLIRAGEMVIHDDGRATLPRDLEPGEQLRMAIDITAPAEPGDYVLELDLVHEMITWFKQKGSPTARVRAKVRGRSAPQAKSELPNAGAHATPPVMEMHGVAPELVTEAVQAGGGTLVEIAKDGSAGPEWFSHRYTFTRR